MPSPTPGRAHRRLDVASIAAAALELIDDEGLRSFSMRKLGSRLDVNAMAVYHHVQDQEELFDEVAATMFRGVDVPALPWSQPWPELLLAYGAELREALLRHPHALPVYAQRPIRAQEATEWAARALVKLADEGIPSQSGLTICLCVNEYVIGHAMAMSAQQAQARRSRRPAADSPDFGVLAAAAAARQPGDHFEPGLRALIAGLEREYSPST